MNVQIQLVTWNSGKELPTFFESLRLQTKTPYNVVCVDNNSQDETRRLLEKEKISTVYLEQNTGFCHAHNIGFSIALNDPNIDAVLICNPDIILAPDCVKMLTEALQKDTDIGTVGGILLREKGLTLGVNKGIIDSAGIEKKFGYRFVNRFEGKIFVDSVLVDTQVFANTGACLLISRKALSAVSTKKNGRVEYFDEAFFAYKEEIDLGWRIQRQHLRNICIGNIIGFHERHVKKTFGYLGKSPRIVELSYINHLYLLKKNYRFTESPLDFIGILFYKIAKFVSLCLFHPRIARKILTK